jgi:NhaA family Na+:H+ antiporter
MATDIAFAIGVLSLLGSRVPAALKVLLTAMAVIDDLGAIIVIALFYTGFVAYSHLFIALGIFALLIILNRLKVHSLLPYLFGGLLMWYFMWHSGVHPTITGVLLAIAIPFGDGSAKSPSFIVQKWLYTPVAYLILPLFALANTCMVINGDWYLGLTSLNSIGILIGLIVGKPTGIILFSLASVTLGFCTLPQEINWKQIFGIGLLAGIGFTMSIFITLLAYAEPMQVTDSKIAILVASFAAGILGFSWLRWTLKKEPSESSA